MQIMKRMFISTALLGFFSVSSMAQNVIIIYTNDLHAHVDTYKLPYVADGKRAIGGFANITTLVKQEKNKNKATFYQKDGISLFSHCKREAFSGSITSPA